MPKKYDVVATIGEYQKNGQTKKKYQNVGMLIEKDGKFYLKMTCPVVMNDEGQVVNFFGLYEPKSSQQTGKPPSQPSEPQYPGIDPDEKLPF